MGRDASCPGHEETRSFQRHRGLRAWTLGGADGEPATRFASEVMHSHGDPSRSRPNGIRVRADATTSETSMPNPYLPPEMLDNIVDQLHDTEDALRSCSLVSKSWIPRARKHLFAEVGLCMERDMRLWKRTFPDPGTSPARYTKTLRIGLYVVLAGDAEVGSLLGDFSCVVRLEVGSYELSVDTSKVSFIPFRGFSPVLKSLRVVVPILPSSRIFNLILSFPLLEDLDVIIHKTTADNSDGSEEDEAPTTTQPSSPSRFTGSLELYLKGGMEPFARRLLSLPGGIHFQDLALTLLHEEDLLTMMTLVEACARTLEFLDVTWNLSASTCSLQLRPHPSLTSVSR